MNDRDIWIDRRYSEDLLVIEWRINGRNILGSYPLSLSQNIHAAPQTAFPMLRPHNRLVNPA